MPVLKISPFKWDGSYLGHFTMDIVHWTIDYADLHYYHLTIDDISIICLAKQIKDKFPAIADEMKAIFGLPKLGTHTIHLGGKLHLLTYCHTVNGQIYAEPTLSSIEPPFSIMTIKQVQDIFAFRELLGLNISFESSIRFRSDGQKTYPVSFRETSSVVEKQTIALPGTIINKWFVGTTLSTVTKRLVGWSADVEDIVLIADLRKKIEAIIERIDKEFIFYSAYIISRIQNRIETSFSIKVGWQID